MQFTEHVTPRLSHYEDDFRQTYDLLSVRASFSLLHRRVVTTAGSASATIV